MRHAVLRTTAIVFSLLLCSGAFAQGSPASRPSTTTAAPQTLGNAPVTAQPTSTAGYGTEELALSRCAKTDPVVWVNTETKIFHAQGTKWYGKTKAGTYQCRKAAEASGARAALNEKGAP